MTGAWTPESEPTSSDASVTLVEGSSFCLCTRTGDLRAEEPLGVYFQDTRILSRWDLTVDGECPEPLAALVPEPFRATFLGRLHRSGVTDTNLLVERERWIGDGIRENVTGKLLTLDRVLEPALPALLALLDMPVDDPAWQALDPGQRRQRTLDAVRGLLLREAREQPLLVIFEDLHWIDSETQTLLDGLVESVGSARLLLIVNYRPEYQHAWGSKTAYGQMRLDALPAESANELLDFLLAQIPGSPRSSSSSSSAETRFSWRRPFGRWWR